MSAKTRSEKFLAHDFLQDRLLSGDERYHAEHNRLGHDEER